MKRFYLLLILLFTTNFIFSQTISPYVTGEFCPNTEITFTVTVPGAGTPTIIGNLATITYPPYNYVTSGGYTTFNFKGKFADQNEKQTFTVNYGGGNNHPFVYKKIKSLFYAGTCTSVTLNTYNIEAPRCQAQNFNINFSPLIWSTNFESPEMCFGSISTYEYLLPSGWEINGNPSDGTTWLNGDNNVTITSDPSHGAGQYIQIRAINPCGSSPYKRPIGSIYIKRPELPISISSSQPSICTSGGSSTYTLVGLPTSGTVVWSLPVNPDASINGSTTGTSVNVIRTSTENTSVVLTATVSYCGFPPVAIDQLVGLGVPVIDGGYMVGGEFNLINFDDDGLPPFFDNTVCTGAQVHTQLTVNNSSSTIWSRSSANPTNNTWSQTGNEISFYFWGINQHATFKLKSQNNCGSTVRFYPFSSMNCSGDGDPCNFFVVSPNPANGSLKITIPNILPPCDFIVSQNESQSRNLLSKRNITGIRLYDTFGKLKLERSSMKNKELSLNVSGLKSGIYFLEISDGSYSEKQKIIIRK